MRTLKSWLGRLLVVGAALLPVKASANVIMPSFVDMICAPLPSILGTMGLSAVVGVPSLVLVALLEAAVVKRLAHAGRLKRIFWCLLLGNTFSSIFGLFTEIRLHGSIWPNLFGFLLAWLLSAVVESPFVRWALKPQACKFSEVLRYSLIANGASYTALLTVALALTAFPLYNIDPTGLRKELRGQLFVYHSHHRLSVLSHLPTSRMDAVTTDQEPYTSGFYGSSTGRMFLKDKYSLARELTRSGDRWVVSPQPLLLPGTLLAVGSDGQTLVCGTTNRIVLVDNAGHQKSVLLTEAPDVMPVRAALSSDNRYLAYTIQEMWWFSRQDAYGVILANAPPQFWQDYGDLFLRDLVGGTTLTVGRIQGNEFGFHPHDNRLAFKDLGGSIEILNVETGKRTMVASPKFAASNIAWSPDGKCLAWMQWHAPSIFISRGYDGSLWVSSVDGNRQSPLPVVFPYTALGMWNLAWRSD
jgi:hypothetical protein